MQVLGELNLSTEQWEKLREFKKSANISVHGLDLVEATQDVAEITDLVLKGALERCVAVLNDSVTK
jgi:hypothetical protein